MIIHWRKTSAEWGVHCGNRIIACEGEQKSLCFVLMCSVFEYNVNGLICVLCECVCVCVLVDDLNSECVSLVFFCWICKPCCLGMQAQGTWLLIWQHAHTHTHTYARVCVCISKHSHNQTSFSLFWSRCTTQREHRDKKSERKEEKEKADFSF